MVEPDSPQSNVGRMPVLGLPRPMPVTLSPPWDSTAPSWVMQSRVAQMSWE